MPRSACQACRPPSGAPCQLQDVPRRAEGLERSGNLCDLPIPFLGRCGTSVVAAAPPPPLVVLGCTSLVVRPLLGEEFLVAAHVPSVANAGGGGADFATFRRSAALSG